MNNLIWLNDLESVNELQIGACSSTN